MQDGKECVWESNPTIAFQKIAAIKPHNFRSKAKFFCMLLIKNSKYCGGCEVALGPLNFFLWLDNEWLLEGRNICIYYASYAKAIF